jgi:predicted flap endonuclease-1-like 5' DNA nuclease
MFEDGSLNVQTILVLLVGFLVGIIPAMLLVGFYGGRQVEKQQKALKLKYDRQITTLKATVRRTIQRIELLTNERNLLNRSNQSLREAIRDQHNITDAAVQELELSQSQNLNLKKMVETLTEENLRHEGRLEQSLANQEHMASRFEQTINQFTEAERLRKHVLFAANQLREAQVSNQALESFVGQPLPAISDMGDQNISPDKLDVIVINGIESKSAARLHESGIHTVADLSKQTPARVAYFTGINSWNESAVWIAEAKARVAGYRAIRA